MIKRSFGRAARVWAAGMLLLMGASPAAAQTDGEIRVRGFGMIGNLSLSAADSFDAVLDRNSGPIFGGGAQVLLPWNIYLEIGAWRFKEDGERVFIAPDGEIIKLGIPLEITMTPLEVTGGYRFTMFSRRFIPYAGLGYSSYRYRETSPFADADEDVDDTFSGFHLQTGAELRLAEWLGVGGEIGWATVPDALGAGGVSAHFNEDDLGGTTIRFKITVGR